MDYILIAWLLVTVLFVGIPGIYYMVMKRQSRKPWKLDITENYSPLVAILVPVHNEEKTIDLKLKNLSQVQYPSEKIQIIIANDASTDGTMAEISRHISSHNSPKLSIFDSKTHLGKAECLNHALKLVNSEIVIISDADCFWPSDVLLKALPYMSDPAIGAITGRELLLNDQGSWVTKGERFYDQTVQNIRIGESKFHSTIIFQGGFAAYKRSVFHKFNSAIDDSGTALDILQNNFRTLLVPEVIFYTTFPTIWRNKISLKIRRASQLQHLWAICLSALIKGKLAMPKRIAVPEIWLHIFNPLFLIAISVLSIFVFLQNPLLLFAFLLVLLPALLVKRTRIPIFEAIQNNLILLFSLSLFLTNTKFKLWKTIDESRSVLTEAMLKNKNLV